MDAMDAKELHDCIKAQPEMFLILGTDRYPLELILRALLLLASVEGSGDEVVRELRQDADHQYAWSYEEMAYLERKAAARIVSDAQEKERLRAELASVRGHADLMRVELLRFGTVASEAARVAQDANVAALAYRAARKEGA